MTNGLRVLMLLTDGFGGIGGIAKFNRDFLQALDSCAIVERVNALPRLIPEPIESAIPESVLYDRRAARGTGAFLRRLIAHGWRGGPVDLVICGHLNLLPAAWLLARFRGARLAVIIHGIEAWVPSRKVLANLLVRSVDTVIAVSHYSAERFARWSKVPIEQTFILPNCVELDTFQPQPRDRALQERYRLGSSKVILTVGRMASRERYKGFDEVIELMPRLLEQFSDLKYLIVGEGDDRVRLEAKARALGVSDKVVFAGRIPECEKVAHYNLADVYVMASTGEGFGIVLIEAAACGIPIVGSATDGSRDALFNGLLGRLVDPSKPNELVEAIGAAMHTEPRRVRNRLVETFGISQFRARVAEWTTKQAELAAV